MVHFGDFWKPEAWGKTVLPGKSLFIEQKSVKNAKIQKFECDSLSNSNNMDKFLNKKLAIAPACIMQKTATLNYPRLFFSTAS